MSPTDKILRDLPTIQQIATRPERSNPLLALILQQAQALSEIAGWAGAASQSVSEQAAQPRPLHPVVDDEQIAEGG